jgi:hypothetical protein
MNDLNDLNYSKYNIVYTQLFNRRIHGQNETSHPNIDEYHMTLYIFENAREWYNEIELDDTDTETDTETDNNEHTHFNTTMNNSIRIHPYRRLRYEIAQVIDLPTGESVSILKTHYIRLIQRKWKKIVEMRKLRLRYYKRLDMFVKRERYTH